jgi:hypothetical protein
MEDGAYHDLITGQTVNVDHGILKLKEPLFLKAL